MLHFALRRSRYPDCVSTFFAFLTFLHSTALGFGFMGMMIGVLQKSHAQLCDKYSKLSLMQPLHWIPIAVLFVLKYVVALVIYYFEVMHRNGVSYAGMTGETVFESAKRAQSIMATDGALVLTEHSGTGNRTLFDISVVDAALFRQHFPCREEQENTGWGHVVYFVFFWYYC